MIAPSLLIVGDSIALGATEVLDWQVVRSAPQSFVEILRTLEPTRTITVNAAVRRTTKEAIAKLPALLAEHRPAIALLAMGGNDADIDWRRYIVSGGARIQHNVPIDQFEANLASFVALARVADVVPVLSDLPRGDILGRGTWLSTGANGIGVLAMVAASGGALESERRWKAYDDAVTRVANEQGVIVARWAAAFEALPRSDRYGPDALHPSDAAHATIAASVAATLASVDERVVQTS